MNNDDIKKRTRPYFLPDLQRTVIDAAVNSLVHSTGEGAIKIVKTIDDKGKAHLSVEVIK